MSTTVVFVQMPWASVRRPSLAFGILTSLCREAGVSSTVLYPNLDIAHRIGIELADHLARDRFSYGVSEHLFAADLFGRDAVNSDAYLDSFEAIAGKENPTCPADAPGRLRWLRDEVIPEFLDALTARIVNLAPEVVGLSATFNQVMSGVALAKRVKAALPGVRVIAGGACYDGSMGIEYHRAVPEVLDHVFVGEAEVAMREFLGRLRAGQAMAGIPGVTWTEGGEVRLVPGHPLEDLNESPVPDYDDYFVELDRAGRLGMPVAIAPLPFESSRGCWWGQKSQCTFCGTNQDAISHRAKRTERAIADLVTLSARYRQTRFAATDLVMPRGADLLEQLAELDLDLELFYEVRTQMSKREMHLLSKARVKEVQAGIESFSTPALALMHKGSSALRNIQFLRWAQEAQVRVVYNVLDGFPGEEPKWYEDMADLVASIVHLEPPRYDLVAVELHRFSPLLDRRLRSAAPPLPRADYAFNFPRGKVDESQIAYFFENGPAAPDPPHRIRVAAAVKSWRETWMKPIRPSYRYAIGPGFLRIVDRRSQQERIFNAAELHHDIILLCDQVRSRTALARDLSGRWPSEVEGGMLERTIDELAAADVLVCEGKELLTLPTCEAFRSTEELRSYVLSTERVTPAPSMVAANS